MSSTTRYNLRKLFSRKNLLPDTDGSKPTTAAAERIFQQNIRLLERFKQCYDSLQDFREYRERNKRYLFGDQLFEEMPDPDGCGYISEREYMVKQGITPMVFNVIRKAVKAVVGVYCQSNFEPLAISRDRDEQKLGEMMTIAMEYAYQNLNLPETNTRCFEEFLISGLVGFRVGFGKNDERETGEVEVDAVDDNRIGFDSNTSGQYFKNLGIIGYLHDMSIGEVLKRWAHSKREKEQILQIYRECQAQWPITDQQFTQRNWRNNIDFYRPVNPQDCRVIEIWTKEQYDSLYCHDTAKGEQYYVPLEDEQFIVAENNRRVLEMVQAGGDASKTALIEYEYAVENKWTVRFLTPNGYVLYQGETPYQHGSHPFVIGAYPLIDGEIHSFVEDAINPQRMTNRLLMRIEYQRMNDLKGITVVNKRLREASNVSLDAIASKITSPNAVIELEWEAGEEPLKQYHSQSNTNGDVQMFQTYMGLLDEVTGAHGAMRGENAKSGTPASLYAQETENANNNIADLLKWYNGLIRERDYKIMQVIQQYYTDKRHINIAGKDYSEQSKWYDPDKVRNSKFDLSLVENQSQGIFRAANENLLLQLLKMQVIDPQTYLESSTSPFADKLLERIKAKQAEAAAAQEQQAMMQPQQQ